MNGPLGKVWLMHFCHKNLKFRQVFFFAMSVKSYLFDPSRSTISDMEVHDFFMFLVVIFSPLFVLFR